MIIGTIAFVFLIATIAAGGNGEWGSFWLGVVIICILLFFLAVSREQDRAYNNFVTYWARGGPNAERERTRTLRRRSERSFVQRDRSVCAVERGAVEDGPLCARCGTELSGDDVITRVKYSDSARFVTYKCPFCGERKMIKV